MTRVAYAAALALVVIGVVRLMPDVPPADDFALFDLHLIDAMHSVKTTGAYSQYGWNHPGPLLFYLFAPLYWLGGYRHMAVVLMAAIVNAGSLVALAAVLGRQAARPGLLVAAALSFGVFVWRSWGLLASPWNPHIAILPLALLVVTAAAASAGAYRLIPAAAALASFTVQTHVGFTGPATAVALAAALILVVRDGRPSWRARRPPPGVARALGAAALVTLALWALPLADAFAPGGAGNLQQIARFFLDGDRRITPEMADAAFARFVTAPVGPSLSLPFGETRVGDPDQALSVLWRVEILLVAGVALASWVRRRTFEASLATISLAATVAAWISVRQMPQQPLDYTVYWVSVLGVMNWTIITAPALSAVVDRLRLPRPGGAVRRWSWRAAVAATLLVAAWQASWWHARLGRRSGRVVRVAATVEGELARTGTAAPRLRFSHDAWGVTAGVALELVRAGARPSVDADWTWMFASRQAPTGSEDLTIFVATTDDEREDVTHRSNYRYLDRAEDMYVYAIEPPPPGHRLDPPPAVVESFVASPMAARRLPEQAAAGSDKPQVAFQDAGAFVTLALPPVDLIGIRLRGEGDSLWQLRCAGADGEFSRIGRVRLEAGPGPRSGNAYLRTLAGCRRLKIAPGEDRAMWLDDVELVEAPGPATDGRTR